MKACRAGVLTASGGNQFQLSRTLMERKMLMQAGATFPLFQPVFVPSCCLHIHFQQTVVDAGKAMHTYLQVSIMSLSHDGDM